MPKYVIENGCNCAVDVTHRVNMEPMAEIRILARADKNGVFMYEEETKSVGLPFLDKLKVIFSGPCTIIIDGDKKTIVRTQDGEKYRLRKGLYMCLLKHTVPPKVYTDIIGKFYSDPRTEKNAAKAVLTYIYGKQNLEEFVENTVTEFVDRKMNR